MAIGSLSASVNSNNALKTTRTIGRNLETVRAKAYSVIFSSNFSIF